jgi:hypothetical protein
MHPTDSEFTIPSGEENEIDEAPMESISRCMVRFRSTLPLLGTDVNVSASRFEREKLPPPPVFFGSADVWSGLPSLHSDDRRSPPQAKALRSAKVTQSGGRTVANGASIS